MNAIGLVGDGDRQISKLYSWHVFTQISFRHDLNGIRTMNIFCIHIRKRTRLHATFRQNHKTSKLTTTLQNKLQVTNGSYIFGQRGIDKMPTKLRH